MTYRQRVEEIVNKAFSGEVNWAHDQLDGTGTLIVVLEGIKTREDRATAKLLTLMDEFGDELIGPDMPRKVEYFDEVEQQNVYSNELDLSRRTQNELRAVARNRKKELLS